MRSTPPNWNGPAQKCRDNTRSLLWKILHREIAMPTPSLRVLIECDSHEYLIKLALMRLGEDPGDISASFDDYLRRSNFGKFDWLHIDRFFAIPLELHPKESKRFLVRGLIEVKEPDTIPVFIDNESAGGPARVFSDPAIGAYRMRGINRPVGDTARVRERLQSPMLNDKGLDGAGVAIAIVDSGIYRPRLTRQLGFEPSLDEANSWRPDHVATQPGMHRLGHGTMCAYDALIAAPKATLIDVPMLIDRPPADHTVSATVSAAVDAYRHLINKWIIGPRPNYKALVVSNSWGIFNPGLDDFPPEHEGRFIDNPNHPFRSQIQRLSGAGVDIVFCGSNCGPECTSPACLSQTSKMIMGANAYPEVLTVGGCDTDNDVIGYSSRGPARPMFPSAEVQQRPELERKPDISAYTHFLGSKTRCNYLPDTGVSAACPVAAGCIAALRTKVSPAETPPDALFSVIKQTARGGNDAGPGGIWNEKFGHGIIDPAAAARTLGLIPIEA